ncbi:hypothetical protein KKI24_18130 [bacterium]|nr:hypothetical protein [bacterium]
MTQPDKIILKKARLVLPDGMIHGTVVLEGDLISSSDGGRDYSLPGLALMTREK